MQRTTEDDDWRGYISLRPDTDLRKLVQLIYDMSETGGMGLFQYKPGELPPHVLDYIMAHGTWNDVPEHRHPKQDRFVLTLDYVLGRRLKFTLREGPSGHYFVWHTWEGHDDSDMVTLLVRLGEVTEVTEAWHKIAEAKRAVKEKDADEELDDQLAIERALLELQARGGRYTAPLRDPGYAEDDDYEETSEDRLLNDLWIASLYTTFVSEEGHHVHGRGGETYVLSEEARAWKKGDEIVFKSDLDAGC